MDGQSNGLHAPEHLVVMTAEWLWLSGCSLALIWFLLSLPIKAIVVKAAEGGEGVGEVWGTSGSEGGIWSEVNTQLQKMAFPPGKGNWKKKRGNGRQWWNKCTRKRKRKFGLKKKEKEWCETGEAQGTSGSKKREKRDTKMEKGSFEWKGERLMVKGKKESEKRKEVEKEKKPGG